jgi:hypothetical protein
MIRYLLHIPKKQWQRPETPRREVLVSLSGTSLDDLATLQFQGEENDIKMVRDALINSARGERGAIIEEETTPAHLVVAMHGPVMRVFQPERLEGGKLFQPPDSALDEDIDRIAEIVVLLFTETLPPLPSFNEQARAQLIERLRFIRALCESICREYDHIEHIGDDLASRMRKRLDAANIDQNDLQQILRESTEFLDVVLLDIPQTGQQVAEMLRKLVQFMDDRAEADISALCKDLSSIWRSGSEQ